MDNPCSFGQIYEDNCTSEQSQHTSASSLDKALEATTKTSDSSLFVKATKDISFSPKNTPNDLISVDGSIISQESPTRPLRAKKTIERFEKSFSSPKESPIQPITEGKGVKLGDIERIVEKINKRLGSDEVLKGLHRLLFLRPGESSKVKANLRNFSGINFTSDVDRETFTDKLGKWTTSGLRELCDILDLEKSGDKTSVVERVTLFLQSPRDSGKKSAAKKSKKPSSAKRKSSKKISKKSNTRKVVKKKQKTAFDYYLEDNVGSSADMSDETTLQKLKSNFNQLSPDELKKYTTRGTDDHDDIIDSDSDVVSGDDIADSDDDESDEDYDDSKNTGQKRSAQKEKKLHNEPIAVEKIPSDSVEDKKDSDVEHIPSDEAISKQIKAILTNADLETVTKKTVRQSLDEYFGISLFEKKEFINRVIDESLGNI